MKIKIKDMECRNSKRFEFKKYVCNDFSYKDYNGKMSLGVLKMLSPICGVRNGEKIVLNRDNYLWLQIGVKELPYWLTGLYDDKKNLVEFYFDITKENILDKDNPIFYDMFLDVVYTKDKDILTLDEDELEDALNEKVITREEYEKVLKDGEKLKEYLKSDGDEIIRVCSEKLDELYEIVNEGE